MVDQASDIHRELEVEDFRILDGLQRTYRLKTIFNSNKLINELNGEGELLNSSPLSITRKFKKRIADSNSSATIVRKLINIYDGEILSNDELFSSEQWFEIWSNLDVTEQIRKMLLLNAGHTSVSNKHQIEIIFHNYLYAVENGIDEKFVVLKEKNKSSIVSSKSRQVGQFHFSNIITTMLSLLARKPITVNASFLSDIQDFNESHDYYPLEFSDMQDLCRLLLDSDLALNDYYGDLSIQWFGREVVLNGILAAVGKYADEKEISQQAALQYSREYLVSNPQSLNINEFDNARKSLSLSKVNIGQVTKSAVYKGFLSLLKQNEKTIDWSALFGGEL
ncbi:hypothetical protein IHC93_19740 [Photobacterium damselae subsp. damselae]|uniref:hypothetical protein n=1 Tax=Photobacterium damselae TaxID=38293 RepID=UPI001F3E6F2D|nr:hypothetical protein [Photobacterium damselae]UKA27157.1 hypothetical protein IHC93_19740 [Photobacterium damselae subsp. damselae]